MYARTAPHPMFLLIVFTLCGAATILFALGSVRPALRAGGWSATVGSVLLALSVPGLGDLLTPFERVACRIADPGCTTAQMISNSGGKLDNALTSIGLLVLALAAASVLVPELSGLFERLVAVTGAAALAALAAGILHRFRDMGAPETSHLAETAKL